MAAYSLLRTRRRASRSLCIAALVAVQLVLSRAITADASYLRQHPFARFDATDGELPSATDAPLQDYDYCKAGIPAPQKYRKPNNAELRGVILITRHGDRTPTKSYAFENVTWDDCDVPDISYLSGTPGNRFEQSVVTPPNNPFARTTWDGNCIPGQLTRRGMLMHKQLGESLREIYVDQLAFLPETMNDTVKDSLYVRSTNVWRTLQSAKSMLQGLYPATDASNDNVHPILIETYHPDVETMDLKLSCKRYKNLRSAMPSDRRFRKHMLGNIGLAERMDEILHMDPPSLERDDGFRDLADGLACRLCHGKPMPCDPDHPERCITEADARRAMDMHQWEYQFGYRDYNEEYNSLGIGFFLGELADAIEHLTMPDGAIPDQASTEGKGPVQPGRFRFYSAHDATIAAVLGSLEPTELLWPQFRSNLLFELWEDTSDGAASDFESASSRPSTSRFFIRMIYNGRVPTFYSQWCDMHRCPLDVFAKHLRALVPTDPKEACKP